MANPFALQIMERAFKLGVSNTLTSPLIANWAAVLARH